MLDVQQYYMLSCFCLDKDNDLGSDDKYEEADRDKVKATSININVEGHMSLFFCAMSAWRNHTVLSTTAQPQLVYNNEIRIGTPTSKYENYKCKYTQTEDKFFVKATVAEEQTYDKNNSECLFSHGSPSPSTVYIQKSDNLATSVCASPSPPKTKRVSLGFRSLSPLSTTISSPPTFGRNETPLHPRGTPPPLDRLQESGDIEGSIGITDTSLNNDTHADIDDDLDDNLDADTAAIQYNSGTRWEYQSSALLSILKGRSGVEGLHEKAENMKEEKSKNRSSRICGRNGTNGDMNGDEDVNTTVDSTLS
jgi:hypothetical protein